MKFRTASQDHQAWESAVKRLSQGHNRMAQILNREHVDYSHRALTTRPNATTISKDAACTHLRR